MQLTFPQQLYLGCVVAEDYPEQCPEHKVATWWDLLWFLIPIMGWLIFVEIIKDRYERLKK